MKSETHLLAKILSDLDGILSREGDARKQLATITVDKDTVIKAASGPDDHKALEQIGVLASREALLNRQLTLLLQAKAGTSARLLGEAVRVRDNLTIELESHHETLEAKLKAALAGFYPSGSKQLARALEGLVNGAHQAPVFATVQKATAGLRGRVFNPRDQRPEGYAKGVLNAAQRAEALLAQS